MSDALHTAGGATSPAGDERTRAYVERELAVRKESINRRIDELEEEIVSTPAAIKSSVRKNPLVGVAGALAAGLAVGLLVAGRRRKGATAPLHQRLVENYIDAVGEDVRYRMRRGRTIEEAVRESLEGRTPFILYSPVRTEESETAGVLRQFGDIVLKTALGFTVKAAIDFLTARLDIQQIQQALEFEEASRRSEAAAAHAGDGASGPIGSEAVDDGAGL